MLLQSAVNCVIVKFNVKCVNYLFIYFPKYEDACFASGRGKKSKNHILMLIKLSIVFYYIKMSAIILEK